MNNNANRIPMLDFSKLNLHRKHYDYDVVPKVMVEQPLPQPKLKPQITEEEAEITPKAISQVTTIKKSNYNSTICAIQ